MAIEVVCRCGQRLKAKEKLAGTKVKCPKCEAVLAVPRLSDATGHGSSAAVAQRPEPAAGPTKRCPSCGNGIPAAKVVCPHCSYSLRLKKRMKNSDVPVTPHPADRAKAEKAKKKKGKQKIPAWGIAVAVAAVFGPVLVFGLAVLAGPDLTLKVSMGSGTIFVFFGIYWIRLIAITEQDAHPFNPFLFFIGLAYAAQNPGECKMPFLVIGLGLLTWVVGFVVAVGAAVVWSV